MVTRTVEVFSAGPFHLVSHVFFKIDVHEVLKVVFVFSYVPRQLNSHRSEVGRSPKYLVRQSPEHRISSFFCHLFDLKPYAFKCTMIQSFSCFVPLLPTLFGITDFGCELVLENRSLLREFAVINVLYYDELAVLLHGLSHNLSSVPVIVRRIFSFNEVLEIHSIPPPVSDTPSRSVVHSIITLDASDSGGVLVDPLHICRLCFRL
mmetsp:Transcript_2438/g.4640  ORF Transcript_2438/g.4640 Transcript_2438/m.4640 type:complete len:206 (-) Transcript_2438:494-1111(-)